MKDYYKGGVLLLLAALASIVTLSIDDHGWDIPIVKFENSDVDTLQQQILAGFDPSETQQPTAAGPVSVPSCFSGVLKRNQTSDLFHGSNYISVKHDENMYLLLVTDQAYLHRATFQTQAANLVRAVPEIVSQRLHQAQDRNDCAKVDVYLAKINY